MFGASPKGSCSQRFTLLIISILLFMLPLLISLYFKLDASRFHSSSRALLFDDALLDEISDSPSFVYFPTVDVLLAYMAKGGSTSLFRWMYRGVTGDEEYSKSACGTNVQDPQSPCWQGKVSFLFNLTRSERRHALTSPSTYRMAVQRDPFDRLISAFNDKFACVSPEWNAQLPYTYIVPYLRDRASLPAQKETCMNISEFADALDALRLDQHRMPLQKLDFHIRPQQFYFEHIAYDIVLDVTDLSNASVLRPVWERLPFGELVQEGVGRYHAVEREELMISEAAAKKLFRFASESRMGERRLSQ